MQNPGLDLTDEENNEISGEFGDNISMSSRGRDSIVAEVIAPPLPPEDEEPEMKFVDHFKVLNPIHMKALIWKNFLWMWRNVG